MIPTYAIEYLLTLQRPGGGRLVIPEASQILIPIFPPNTSLTLSVHPYGSDYSLIKFGLGFGPNMVPNTFQGYVQTWGSREIQGTLTAEVLNTELQGFVLITQSEPSVLSVTNISGLNQVFEIDSVNLRISTEDDYKLVLEALARLGTSAKLEQLAQEAVLLLGKLVGEAPPPPAVVP